MQEATINRDFALDIQLDPVIFLDSRKMVNYYVKLLARHPDQFPASSFKNKGMNSVKKLYDSLKKFLKSNGMTLPKYFTPYLERLHRCNFQHPYFMLGNYHRKRKFLLDISDVLLPQPWWQDEVLSSLEFPKMNYSEQENSINQYRNLLMDALKEKLIVKEKDLQVLLRKFLKSYTPELESLDKLKRQFKQRLGKYLNAEYKRLQKKPDRKGWAAELVRTVCTSNWEKDRKQWRKEQNKQLDQLSVAEFTANFKLKEVPDYAELIRRIFHPRKAHAKMTSGSVDGFKAFVNSYLQSQCKQAFADFLGKQLQQKIKKVEKELTSSFSESYPSCLKLPEFRASSIPLGIDDGRVYKTEDDMHLFRFLKKEKFRGIQITEERYTDLIKSGWTPKRGVLRLSRGNIIYSLPLTKEVPDELESNLVAAGDLGLVDGIVVSVMNLDSEKEVDRVFIDQKQCAGKKDEWFLPGAELKNPPNFKRKLFWLRGKARSFQSKRMGFEHPNKHKTRAYWYLRREEKKAWQQIRGVHNEMINQYATRLVAYCVHHKIGFISLENLKWSRHGLKSKVGPFLGHWQVHWFFAQLQEKIEEIALMHGIRVIKVNARNTSKKCHECDNIGKRAGKWFSCLSAKCGWQGDADLNAARNIAKRAKKRCLEKRGKHKKTTPLSYMLAGMVSVGMPGPPSRGLANSISKCLWLENFTHDLMSRFFWR